MSSFNVSGCVKVIMDEMVFESGFRKREFVLTLPDERYPQDIKFSALKERISILDGVSPGDEVTVTFDLRGHEYQGRYYVDLVAWKLEKDQAGKVGDGTALPTDTCMPWDSDEDDLDDVF